MILPIVFVSLGGAWLSDAESYQPEDYEWMAWFERGMYLPYDDSPGAIQIEDLVLSDALYGKTLEDILTHGTVMAIPWKKLTAFSDDTFALESEMVRTSSFQGGAQILRLIVHSQHRPLDAEDGEKVGLWLERPEVTFGRK